MSIELGYLAHAEGSALISMGGTTVLCAVTTENRLPRFAIGTGSGWITAEYSMPNPSACRAKPYGEWGSA